MRGIRSADGDETAVFTKFGGKEGLVEKLRVGQRSEGGKRGCQIDT